MRSLSVIISYMFVQNSLKLVPVNDQKMIETTNKYRKLGVQIGLLVSVI